MTRKLSDDDKQQLMALLRLRRKIATKKLMARFKVGRTTIWKMDDELRELYRCKQNVRERMLSPEQAELLAKQT